MTKTAEKPYPLGPHIPIYSPYKGVPPPGVKLRERSSSCQTGLVIGRRMSEGTGGVRCWQLYHSERYGRIDDKDQEQANAILCSIQGAEDESPKHDRKSINESRVEAVKPCSDDLKPQQDHGEELSAQINVVELPSFSFRLDFLAF